MNQQDRREGAEVARCLSDAVEQTMHTPDIVPQHTAAKQCGLSRNLVGVWIKRRKLTTVAVYGERWVSITAVEQVIESRGRISDAAHESTN